jgi:hypothetical protein
MPLLHGSIADIHEREFVEHVLSDRHHRGTLFNIKGLDARDSRILREVDLSGLRRTLKGDVDILVIPPDAPEEATAIEVKRFKVGLNAIRTGKPNGLREFV